MQEHLDKLYYYFNRLFEYPFIKLILSLSATSIQFLFGEINEPVLLIFILLLVDLITGLLKGIKLKLDYHGTYINVKNSLLICRVSIKTIKSRAMREGLLKVIEYFIALFLATMIGKMYSFVFFRTLVIYWIGFTEFKSILENLHAIGIRVPSVIIICVDCIGKVLSIKTDSFKEVIKKKFNDILE